MQVGFYHLETMYTSICSFRHNYIELGLPQDCFNIMVCLCMSGQ